MRYLPRRNSRFVLDQSLPETEVLRCCQVWLAPRIVAHLPGKRQTYTQCLFLARRRIFVRRKGVPHSPVTRSCVSRCDWFCGYILSRLCDVSSVIPYVMLWLAYSMYLGGAIFVYANQVSWWLICQFEAVLPHSVRGKLITFVLRMARVSRGSRLENYKSWVGGWAWDFKGDKWRHVGHNFELKAVSPLLLFNLSAVCRVSTFDCPTQLSIIVLIIWCSTCVVLWELIASWNW